MLRDSVLAMGALAGVLLFAAPAAAASLTVFAPQVFNDPSGLDVALGYVGSDFIVEDFEDDTLLPGLLNSADGGPQSSTLSFHLVSAAHAWDGVGSAVNRDPFDISVRPTRWTFHYAAGTTTFGVGIANLQPQFGTTRLFVNGSLLVSQIEVLGPFEHSDGGSIVGQKNGYLRIDADPGEVITSVTFEIDVGSGEDFEVDHIVLSPIPEPGSASMLALGLAGLAYRRRRRSSR